MTDVEKLDKALEYLDENGSFMKKFIRSYRMWFEKPWRIARIVSGMIILFGIFIMYCILTKDQTWENWLRFPMPLIYLADIAVFIFLCKRRSALAELYEEENVGDLMHPMYVYTNGLSFYFWNKRTIKKLKKLLKDKTAPNIIEAARILKPNFGDRKLKFDTEKFDAQSRKLLKIQQKKIDKYNQELEKANAKAQRDARTIEFLGNIIQNQIDDANAMRGTSSYSSGGYGTADQAYNSPSYGGKSKKQEEAEEEARKKAEYARQAQYWEDEYRRLCASGAPAYQINKAEYQKNYYRRISK